MHEFLAIVSTFVLGIVATAALAAALEHRALVGREVDEDADVPPRIVTVTASGYAVGPSFAQSLAEQSR